MPLPLIIGGIGAAIAGISAHAVAKSLGSYYYIKKSDGELYLSGIEEKRLLFIKWRKPQWVLDYDDAKAFAIEEDADEYVQVNKLKNVEIVKKIQNHVKARGW
jgi:hypothetical protein